MQACLGLQRPCTAAAVKLAWLSTACCTQVRGSLAQRLALLGAMGGTQGLVGWWMVRSGLQACPPQQPPA